MEIKLNTIEKKIFSFFNYYFLFFPLFLVLSPFFSDLFVVISGLFTIFLIKKYKFYQFFNISITKIFFIFFFLMIISSIFSDYKLYSLKTSLPYVRFIFFSFFLILLFSFKKNSLKYFFFMSLFVLTILFFVSVYQFFNEEKKNLLGYELVNKVRITSLFKDEQILGSYSFRLSIICLLIAIILRINKKFLFLLIILTTILTILSGERMSLLFINLINMTSILLFTNSIKKKIIFILIYIFFQFSFLFFSSDYKYRFINQTQNQIEGNINEKNIYEFKFKFFLLSKEHNDHIYAAVNIYLKNIILGIGPKNFYKYCEKENSLKDFNEFNVNTHSRYLCSTHPHNSIVQLFLETGFFGGLIGIFILLVSTINFIFKIFRTLYTIKCKINLLKYLLFIIYLMPILPSGSFFHNWNNFFLYTFLGIYIYSKKKFQFFK